MRRGMNVGVALVGLLVVAAISVAAGSGRRPPVLNTASSVRMLTKAEAAEVSQRFPKLGPQPEGIARMGSDLLERLLPGSSFYRVYDYDYEPEFPYLVATSGDKLLRMPDGFNRLLHEHGLRVTDKNVMEMAEAFALLVMGNAQIYVEPNPPARLDTFPPVTFLGAKRTKLRYGGTFYETELKLRIGGQDEVWYFDVWRGQFGSVVRQNTKGVTIDFYVPIPAESPPEQGQLDTLPSLVIRTDSGSNAYVENDTGGRPHYYMTVDSNNIVVDTQVVFSLSGFLPDSNVYVLVYDFIRDPKIPRYLHKVQMNSGCGRDTWKPGVESTLIYHVSAGYVSDTMHAWNTYTIATLKSELTPEKVITGTFPDCDTSLSIHYCDQFFTSPVNDTHAVTFARYVDSAMTQSWRTQVHTWGLGVPPDSDSKHEVFINDGTHWYH
jgi:hypothetical protein